MKKCLLLVGFIFTSCREKPADGPKCEMTDYYIPAVAVMPVLTKTCEEAGATPFHVIKDYTSADDFPLRLIVKHGGARFRSEPDFNSWQTNNVLGFVAEKNELFADGPFKNLRGIYYTIPILDSNDELCLAYVSIAVVSEKQASPATQALPTP